MSPVGLRENLYAPCDVPIAMASASSCVRFTKWAAWSGSVSSISRVITPSAPWPSSLSPIIVSSEPRQPSSPSTVADRVRPVDDLARHVDVVVVVGMYGGEMKETYGVPVEEIQEGIRHGVRKVNIDTDIRLAMTAAVRKFLAENPSKFLKPALLAAKAICKERYEQFGCAGMASKIKALPLLSIAGKYQSGELRQVVN